MTPSNLPGPGAPHSVARFCAECGAALSAGAHFCHRCGTPTAQGPTDLLARPVTVAAALPWTLAGVGLVVLVALLANRAPTGGDTPANQPGMASPPLAGSGTTGSPAGGQPPDIGTLTPSERANRLYVRVMQYAEAGKNDSVARFAPMVLAAHQMLPVPTVDERYHFGRVAEVVGTREIASAQADTILRDNPSSLLGLVLAARAARLNGDAVAAKAFDRRLLAALDRELATQNADYDNHRAEIDQAVADARRPD
ncbi:MAG: zinc ribbon domain-containing protein [Gemmatimonadaceae bacterium]|nr:zinc ribbon domain-containing protein [Gemmatimonadaceae bacterium]